MASKINLFNIDILGDIEPSLFRFNSYTCSILVLCMHTDYTPIMPEFM